MVPTKRSSLSRAAINRLGDKTAIVELDTDGNVVRPLDASWQPLEGERIAGALFGPGSITGKMRILAITPAHPGYGIRPQTWAGIQAAIDTYKGPIDWVISSGDNPLAQPYQNVMRHHNKARRMALDGNYDALLSIEADMIIPPDAIEKLLAADADIAYGLYVWRHNLSLWNAYIRLNMFKGMSLSKLPDKARESWGQIIDVAGLGMGCTLIKRRVLEHLPFRLYDGRKDWITEQYGDEMERLGIDPFKPREAIFCDDWLLAVEARRLGYSQRANLDLICGHIANDGILWPDIDSAKLYRKVEHVKQL